MYPTHTLLAQVAADRTADAERHATEIRQRRARGSRRTGFAGLRAATQAPQTALWPVATTAPPNATTLRRPRSEAA
jgi:hypothetical protein